MNEQDIYYYYNSLIDPIQLIKKNLLEGIQSSPAYLTNAFGLMIDPEIFPEILGAMRGTVEDPPIPANWHADIAEFGAVFRSIELDKKRDFVMCELGCAWGCWMNNSGIIAKKNGHSVHLIGVEGDKEFINLAKKTLMINKFTPDEFTLYHGIISFRNGMALFPKHDPQKTSFGFEPILDASLIKRRKLMKSAKYIELPQISLKSALENYDFVDLLHVDIQGGEESLIPSCIPLLNEKVGYLVIGTHSRQIEGKMFECLINAGWLLEIERPAILQLSMTPKVSVDGVQGWRNLKLLPINKDFEGKGEIKITEKSNKLSVSPEEECLINIKITNNSNSTWESIGSNPILISYHWFDKSDKLITFDGERTRINGDLINANETKEQRAKIIIPKDKGEYRLVLTLVQEGNKWFSAPEFIEDCMDVTVM